MGKFELVKQDIINLLAINFGEKVSRYFITTYMSETFPIFVHSSFLVLTDLVGEDKARSLLNSVLYKNQVEITYE